MLLQPAVEVAHGGLQYVQGRFLGRIFLGLEDTDTPGSSNPLSALGSIIGLPVFDKAKKAVAGQ